jgi:hypothetical protein
VDLLPTETVVDSHRVLSPPRRTGIAKLDALVAEGRARCGLGCRTAVSSAPSAHVASKGEVSAALRSDQLEIDEGIRRAALSFSGTS